VRVLEIEVECFLQNLVSYTVVGVRSPDNSDDADERIQSTRVSRYMSSHSLLPSAMADTSPEHPKVAIVTGASSGKLKLASCYVLQLTQLDSQRERHRQSNCHSIGDSWLETDALRTQ
jgi:hypothetical protein